MRKLPMFPRLMFPRFTIAALALALFAGMFSLPVAAVEPDEVMKDPKLEARARVISKDLRCLVCQNQSIDDSNADLAKDLRVLVRDRIREGDSNQQVLDYIVARYGEYVLLNPRIAPHTWAMWFAGPLVLLLSLFWIFRAWRRRQAAAPAAAAAPSPGLSEDEAKQLQDILESDSK